MPTAWNTLSLIIADFGSPRALFADAYMPAFIMLDLAAGIRYPHKLPNINSNYGELRANGYELKRGMSETQ